MNLAPIKPKDSTVSYDAVLLVGFGGPDSPEEVRPFIARVLEGIPHSKERFEEVARHYATVGGRSPYNTIVARQASALEGLLARRGHLLSVYVGLRFARPFIAETLDTMGQRGIRRALAIILSPQQSEASWERYVRGVEEARRGLGEGAPEVIFASGWHDHPLFIEALAARVRDALVGILAMRRDRTPLLLTAHSIPLEMAERSPYAGQIAESAGLLAERLGHPRWQVAYQSRSGKPGDRWLEPDIRDVLRSAAAEGAKKVVVAPLGFVCDNVEILYDLDVEARAAAQGLGITYVRAPTVNDHPLFITMMAEIVEGMI